MNDVDFQAFVSSLLDVRSLDIVVYSSLRVSRVSASMVMVHAGICSSKAPKEFYSHVLDIQSCKKPVYSQIHNDL